MLKVEVVVSHSDGLGDCRCRGAKSLGRWVELVLLAYGLAGLTRWGRQLLQQEPTWLEVRFYWGKRLLQVAAKVKGWLSELSRLLSWLLLLTLSPLPNKVSTP